MNHILAFMTSTGVMMAEEDQEFKSANYANYTNFFGRMIYSRKMRQENLRQENGQKQKSSRRITRENRASFGDQAFFDNRTPKFMTLPSGSRTPISRVPH